MTWISKDSQNYINLSIVASIKLKLKGEVMRTHLKYVDNPS